MTTNDELDLQKALAHEELLVFSHFDENTARDLGLVMRERAESLGPVIVDIRTVANDPLFYVAMPGTTPANADWARRKRNLVNQLSTSSYVVAINERRGESAMEYMALDPRDHAPHGGCFPIRVKGAGMVATVTVSGLPQRDDHKLAVDCIAEYLGVDLGANAF
ncbi:MAG: heme-degrading domain-containing protein [Rhodoluna sp.]